MVNKQSKLVGLFLLALVLLNFPLLGVVQRGALFANIPNMFLYLFLVWLCIIAMSRWVVNASRKKNNNSTK